MDDQSLSKSQIERVLKFEGYGNKSGRYWFLGMEEGGGYKNFDGTKNPIHYIEIIKHLREYVVAGEFERVVGIRFSEYLLDGRPASLKASVERMKKG